MILRARQFTFHFPGPALVMGIVNVTPDSFSDGGQFLDPDAAVAHALELVEQGAGILDVGGESTRPGAVPVAEADELRRVLPVIERLAALHPKVCATMHGSAYAGDGAAELNGRSAARRAA